MKKNLLILLVCILAIVACCATSFLMRPVLNTFLEPPIPPIDVSSSCEGYSVTYFSEQEGHPIGVENTWTKGFRAATAKILFGNSMLIVTVHKPPNCP